MKTKRLFLIVLLVAALCLAGCETTFGSKYVEDPKQYGNWESYLDVPTFLPKSIEEYTVNGYSYTLLAYMDVCYEIFLDITVSDDQLAQIIDEVKAHPDYSGEAEAYYAEGYTELVLEDLYEGQPGINVGWADIEKVIYNEETGNVVYVCFHANDTGVYEVADVAYFNRFGIAEGEYANR